MRDPLLQVRADTRRVTILPQKAPAKLVQCWPAIFGSDFGRTDFSRIFIFGPRIFSRIFSPDFFSSFLWEKCPEKSSRKIPEKILQNLYNKNPPTHFCRLAGASDSSGPETSAERSRKCLLGPLDLAQKLFHNNVRCEDDKLCAAAWLCSEKLLLCAVLDETPESTSCADTDCSAIIPIKKLLWFSLEEANNSEFSTENKAAESAALVVTPSAPQKD